jgi:hypothetical protein
MTASADIARLRSNAGFARGLILAALAVGVIAAVVFLAFPGIDLWATGLFWRAGDGGFWLANAPLIRDRQVIVRPCAIAGPAGWPPSICWPA